LRMEGNRGGEGHSPTASGSWEGCDGRACRCLLYCAARDSNPGALAPCRAACGPSALLCVGLVGVFWGRLFTGVGRDALPRPLSIPSRRVAPHPLMSFPVAASSQPLPPRAPSFLVFFARYSLGLHPHSHHAPFHSCLSACTPFVSAIVDPAPVLHALCPMCSSLCYGWLSPSGVLFSLSQPTFLMSVGFLITSRSRRGRSPL
jgi:hypothetical protein